MKMMCSVVISFIVILRILIINFQYYSYSTYIMCIYHDFSFFVKGDEIRIYYMYFTGEKIRVCFMIHDIAERKIIFYYRARDGKCAWERKGVYERNIFEFKRKQEIDTGYNI